VDSEAGVDCCAGVGEDAGVEAGAGEGAGVEEGAGEGAGEDAGEDAGVEAGVGEDAGVDCCAGVGEGAGVDCCAGVGEGAGVDCCVGVVGSLAWVGPSSLPSGVAAASGTATSSSTPGSTSSLGRLVRLVSGETALGAGPEAASSVSCRSIGPTGGAGGCSPRAVMGVCPCSVVRGATPLRSLAVQSSVRVAARPAMSRTPARRRRGSMRCA
jgi:hypothetical protein